MKIFTETLGCPKNFNDTQFAEGILIRAGHEITNNFKEAEALIINTCGFINDAKVESINKIFEFAKAKQNSVILIVSGCLVQRYSDELFEEIPEADIFIGVNEYEKLPKILDNYISNAKRHKSAGEICSEFICYKYRNFDENPYSATIKISEGCNNRCAYCVIPDIKGQYRSRKIEDIVAEAELLADRGCKELILIAQDVTAYGIDIYNNYMLHKLLEELCGIEKLKWIRLMYCYEDKITDELIDVMAVEEKICHYIDIPIQHCSNKMLVAMNRHSTKKSIENTINKLRNKIPDIHIRTTLITGLPGETVYDFEQLYEFINDIKFERLGVFTYSQEEGTVAAAMPDQLPEKIKEERKDIIMRLQMDISLALNKSKIGQVFDVLVEDCEDDGTYIGRTRFDAPDIDNTVLFTSQRALKKGALVKVKIEDAFDYDLAGTEV